MLIGVVGLNGSGKDTVAEHLVSKHGFAHKDLGQEIRDALKALGMDYLDRGVMIAFANKQRQELGFNYWCKRAIDSLESKDIVITSIRNPSEVDEILSRGGNIIEVYADQKVRFDRTVERVKKDPKLHGDVQSFDEFKKKEEMELTSTDPAKQQLLKCISMAQHRLSNNGSFEDLYVQIEELFPKLKK
ncbi:MAG: AAA family ATPase [Candidatus Micrarchaeaceae archaeon]